MLGKALEVIVDEKADDNVFIARTQKDAPDIDGCVYLEGKFDIGSFYKVKIVDTYEYDLRGILV